MITYPNSNVQGVGDQTLGRIVIIDNVTELTPKKLFSYFKEGLIPVAVTVTSGTFSFAFCSFDGYPSEEAESYTLTIGEAEYAAEGFDAKFVAAE